MEGEVRLQVGLLEHREHAAGIRHLELRVEVDLAVGRVDEAVQSLARVHVDGIGVDGQRVVLGQVRQLDAHPVVDRRDVERLAVEHNAVHLAGDGVDEGGRTRNRRERHRRDRTERLRTRREVEGDVVVLDTKHYSSTLDRLSASQVLSGHSSSFGVRGPGVPGLRRGQPSPAE